MKRIGILTFHRAHNYGAVLQCYALQQILMQLGYDARVIDYRQKFTERIYKLFSLRYFFSMYLHPKKAFSYIVNIRKRYRKNKVFTSFIDRYFNVTEVCTKNIPQDFDIYLIGSDQVWGIHCTNGVEPVYFGSFFRLSESKLFSYAISTNIASLEAVGDEKIMKYASSFCEISFREEAICRKFESMTGIKGRVDIDPTLLTSPSTWDSLIDSKWEKERYILIYQVRYPHGKNVLMEKAEILARTLKCTILDLSSMTYSPEDFVSLFKYALYVVTTSFHATVFSIIFERPLYAIKLNDGHDGRYENILRAVGGENMLVEKDFNPIVQNIDYKSIKNRLDLLKDSSISYLKTLG